MMDNNPLGCTQLPSYSILSSKNNFTARAFGVEPKFSVLETDALPIELNPYFTFLKQKTPESLFRGFPFFNLYVYHTNLLRKPLPLSAPSVKARQMTFTPQVFVPIVRHIVFVF